MVKQRSGLKVIGFALSEAELRDLDRWAQAETRTRSSLLRWLVQRGLAQRKDKGGMKHER